MAIWQQIVDTITHEFTDFADVPTMTRVAIRLFMAAAVGAILGYERESQGKAAGLRTHMLVALGAAIVILAPLVSGANQVSLSRVIQGLVSGVGFLGAGAIIKGRAGQETHGLTTAATIWISAALGMAVGLGRTGTALLGAAMALAILRAIPSDVRPRRDQSLPSDHSPS